MDFNRNRPESDDFGMKTLKYSFSSLLNAELQHALLFALRKIEAVKEK